MVTDAVTMRAPLPQSSSTTLIDSTNPAGMKQSAHSIAKTLRRPSASIEDLGNQSKVHSARLDNFQDQVERVRDQPLSPPNDSRSSAFPSFNLPMAHFASFNGITEEIYLKVMNDEMAPEDRIQPRHNCLYIGNNQVEEIPQVQVDKISGCLRINSSPRVRFDTFLSPIPDALAFSQLWSIYTGIRSMHAELPPGIICGYMMYNQEILHLSTKYPWDKVMQYHLEVHRMRIASRASAAEWMILDSHAFSLILSGKSIEKEKAAGPIRGIQGREQRHRPY